MRGMLDDSAGCMVGIIFTAQHLRMQITIPILKAPGIHMLIRMLSLGCSLFAWSFEQGIYKHGWQHEQRLIAKQQHAKLLFLGL